MANTQIQTERDPRSETARSKERDPRSEKSRYQGLETTLRHIWVAPRYRRWVVAGYARHTVGAR